VLDAIKTIYDSSPVSRPGPYRHRLGPGAARAEKATRCFAPTQKPRRPASPTLSAAGKRLFAPFIETAPHQRAALRRPVVLMSGGPLTQTPQGRRYAEKATKQAHSAQPRSNPSPGWRAYLGKPHMLPRPTTGGILRSPLSWRGAGRNRRQRVLAGMGGFWGGRVGNFLPLG